MNGRLTRRQVLRAAAALAAGLLAPGRAGARQDDPLLELLLAVRVDPEHLAVYAEEYLLAHPGERDPPVLVGTLVGAGGAPADVDVRALLRKKIRDDFDAGRTVTLDGWILSVSEVRLWCLVHLLSQ